jgi:ADP-ribose pyrophosphatase
MSDFASNPSTLYCGQFLELHRDAHWEYVSRPNARGAAFILAITDADEIVLVEQFRIPLLAQSIELPAGIIGDEPGLEDETVIESALRELEEETGFRATSGELLLHGPTAPGMSSEIIYLVRAFNLTRISAGGGVAGESITPHVIPLASVDHWLREQAAAGKRVEPRIYAGLYFASMRSG